MLMVIDPTNFTIAVKLAEASVAQAKADAQNKQAESERRAKLTTLSTSVEEKQIFASAALMAQANLQQAMANLNQAQVNLERTAHSLPGQRLRHQPVGTARDYATVGQNEIALVDADSFWIDGYFEETNLGSIHEGDPASIKPMGYSQIVRGHVGSIAVASMSQMRNPTSKASPRSTRSSPGLRLAQRVPVRIHIDQVPDGVRLVQV